MVKQQIELPLGKTTLAGQTKVLFQALIHLNNQLVDPVVLSARLGTPAETHNIINVWKLQGTVTASTLTVDQHAMLLKTPHP